MKRSRAASRKKAMSAYHYAKKQYCLSRAKELRKREV